MTGIIPALKCTVPGGGKNSGSVQFSSAMVEEGQGALRGGRRSRHLGEGGRRVRTEASGDRVLT